MSSELVSDVFSGLVAAGTLALATATVFLGRAASRAAVDALTPRVFISGLMVEPEPVNWPIAANVEPETIKPGLIWNMAQHGPDRIGLEANGSLRNESTVSALFRFECDPGAEVVQVTVVSGPIAVSAERQERWYVAAPGSKVDFKIIWWQPASVWAEAWPLGSTNSETLKSPPATTARLITRGPAGNAEDRCDLTFGRCVVVPHPREDGWVIAIVDVPWKGIPGTTPGPIAKIGLMRRSYPIPFRNVGQRSARRSP